MRYRSKLGLELGLAALLASMAASALGAEQSPGAPGGLSGGGGLGAPGGLSGGGGLEAYDELGSGEGLGAYGAPGAYFGRDPRSAAHRLRLREAELQAAEEARALIKAKVDAGQGTATDLQAADTAVRRLTALVAVAREDARREARIEALGRIVAEVELKDATVRQAAQALGKAAGLEIQLGEGVSDETRLTVRARRVPVGIVLETIARKANLEIAPDPRKQDGVILKAWPVLEIDGKREFFQGPLAPWSSEWGTVPTAGGLLGYPGMSGYGGLGAGMGGEGRLGAYPASRGFFSFGGGYPGALAPMQSPGGVPTKAVPAERSAAPPPSAKGGPAKGGSAKPTVEAMPGALPSAMGAMGAMGGYIGIEGMPFPTGMGPGNTTIGVGDNMIVLAEPGVNEKGERGFWLTLYKVAGSSLQRVGSAFHRAYTPTRTPTQSVPARGRGKGSSLPGGGGAPRKGAGAGFGAFGGSAGFGAFGGEGAPTATSGAEGGFPAAPEGAEQEDG